MVAIKRQYSCDALTAINSNANQHNKIPKYNVRKIFMKNDHLNFHESDIFCNTCTVNKCIHSTLCFSIIPIYDVRKLTKDIQ